MSKLVRGGLAHRQKPLLVLHTSKHKNNDHSGSLFFVACLLPWGIPPSKNKKLQTTFLPIHRKKKDITHFPRSRMRRKPAAFVYTSDLSTCELSSAFLEGTTPPSTVPSLSLSLKALRGPSPGTNCRTPTACSCSAAWLMSTPGCMGEGVIGRLSGQAIGRQQATVANTRTWAKLFSAVRNCSHPCTSTKHEVHIQRQETATRSARDSARVAVLLDIATAAVDERRHRPARPSSSPWNQQTITTKQTTNKKLTDSADGVHHTVRPDLEQLLRRYLVLQGVKSERKHLVPEVARAVHGGPHA